jgi:hypothetical protein
MNVGTTARADSAAASKDNSKKQLVFMLNWWSAFCSITRSGRVAVRGLVQHALGTRPAIAVPIGLITHNCCERCKKNLGFFRADGRDGRVIARVGGSVPEFVEAPAEGAMEIAPNAFL